MNDGSYFQRLCLFREQFNNDKPDCEENGLCTTVICEESTCKAEFIGSGIKNFFSYRAI